MKSGFTLIELSIVLIIVGLIVGGIVAGRELVAAAEIRAQASQFQQLTMAVYNFKTKYNCLPGDCINATNFITFPTNTGANGNGDGLLESPAGQQFPFSLGGEFRTTMSSLYLTGMFKDAIFGTHPKHPQQ